MAKRTKVIKVALETGVSVNDLNRLPLEALDKLDQLVVDVDPIVVADEDDLLGEAPKKHFYGYHQITGEEIWN